MPNQKVVSHGVKVDASFTEPPCKIRHDQRDKRENNAVESTEDREKTDLDVFGEASIQPMVSRENAHEEKVEHKGKPIVDVTCCPQNIACPTDLVKCIIINHIR
jgi:hypothetical protein